jgi:hypothetical protein
LSRCGLSRLQRVDSGLRGRVQCLGGSRHWQRRMGFVWVYMEPHPIISPEII